MFSRAYIDELLKHNGGRHGMEEKLTSASNDNALAAMNDAGDRLASVFILWLRPSRETSLAQTKLEEALMWAERSICVNGVTGE